MMPKTKRTLLTRLIFWPLLAAFVIGCVWWLLHFDYDPDLMRAAIPPYATMVSEHDDIGARWPQILEHAVVDAVLEAGGGEEDDWREMVRDARVARWLDRLTGPQTLTAYVPEGTPGAPLTGLIVVSWVGKYGQFLRWGWLNRSLPDFQAGRARDGTRIWRCTDESLPRGYVLSLAACEGIALACLSPDRDAAAYLRRRVSHRAPAIDRFVAADADVAAAGTEGVPDRAWVRVGGRRGWQNVRAGMTLPSPRVLSLEAAGYRLPWDARRLGRRNVASMWLLLHDAPDCIVAAPTADVYAMLALCDLPDAARLVFDDLAGDTAVEGAAFACLTSGAFSGRLLSMRVPGLVAGVQMRDGFDVQAATTNVLDRLSAEQGKGLIPCRAEVSGHTVVTIGDARPEAALLMPLEERPAVAAWGNWLLVSSNARVLGRLLAQAHPAGAGVEGADLPAMPAWARELTAGALCGYGWMRTPETCAALRNAIAVYELSLMMKRSDSSRRKREEVQPVKAALTHLAPVGEVVWHLEQTAAEPRTSLRIVSPPAKGLETADTIR